MRKPDLSRTTLCLFFSAGLAIAGCAHQTPTPAESAEESVADLQTAVRETVKDPARAEKMINLVDDLERIMDEANSSQAAHIARLKMFNADYDASEEDFRTLFRQYNTQSKDRNNRLLKIRLQMIDATTDDEWHRLMKLRVRSVEDYMKSTNMMEMM